MNFIGITPEDFKKLTEYVEDLPISFYKAEKAVEVQRIFREARSIVVEPKEPDKK